jgi:hypothetical protein
MRVRHRPQDPNQDQFRVLRLEYPSTADPTPRYGHGRPSHRGLEAMIAAGADRYAAVLRALALHAEALGRFPTTQPGTSEPQWIHEWLIGLDTIALYGFVHDRAPRTYVEVGSGESTKVVRRACTDAGLSTRIRSIDPEPRAEVDRLCDEVLRSPLETVDLDRAFGDVTAGDIVFFDSSHRVLPGSDCVAFFLEVLPSLPAGVLVGVHDVYLPDDYPPGFFELWWSEQYVLAATLLADAGRRYELVLPGYWASGQPELAALLDPVWAQPATDGVNRRSSAFWFEVRG